jgi:hypothetical protein
LLCLKARAWCDLTDRKADGRQVDAREIKKHKNDVFKLYAVLDPDFEADLPTHVATDLAEFLERIAKEDVPLADLGLKGQKLPDVLSDLRRIYGLD